MALLTVVLTVVVVEMVVAVIAEWKSSEGIEGLSCALHGNTSDVDR